MRAEGRIWRTANGELVQDGHPDSAFLAYAEGDEIDKADENRLPGAKSSPPPPNKSRAKTDNK